MLDQKFFTTIEKNQSHTVFEAGLFWTLNSGRGNNGEINKFVKRCFLFLTESIIIIILVYIITRQTSEDIYS